MWRSVIVKDVTVLKWWSNLCFETEQLRGFVSWTEWTNVLPKRQKPFPLRMLSTELQGDLLPKRDHKMDRRQSWEISSRLFCSVKSHDPIAATWSIPHNHDAFKTCTRTVDHRIVGVPLSAFKSRGWSRSSRTTRKIAHSGFETDGEDLQVHPIIAGLDRRLEQHWDLRTLRNLFQKAMHRLWFILGDRHCLLHLWEDVKNRREELRRSNNYDVLSISGSVVKKNNSRGAKHGPSERQRMYCKAREMIQKARQPNHGGN